MRDWRYRRPSTSLTSSLRMAIVGRRASLWPTDGGHRVWWLRVASAPVRSDTLQERERTRRSELIAWLMLALLFAMLIIVPVTLYDPEARVACVVLAVGLVGAVMLNRAGAVTGAGLVLLLAIAGALWVYILSDPHGLTMGQLPTYDALGACTVIIAASVLPRGWIFPVAVLDIATIVADYILQPHYTNIVEDGLLYTSPLQHAISLLIRPIALALVLASVGLLWRRSTDLAIRRADRAEELALLERRERERTIALEEGVRYLHQTLMYWAEGDIRRRVPPMPVDVLEQLRDDLNGYVDRFASLLQAQSEVERFRVECRRMEAFLYASISGRPAEWPVPSGTPLDGVIEALRAVSVRQQAARPSGAPQSDPRRGSDMPSSVSPRSSPPMHHTAS